MDRQEIIFPMLVLEWSSWASWSSLFPFDENNVVNAIPDDAGVYEVCDNVTSDTRLTIGKTGSLIKRIKALVKPGFKNHSSGRRIRESEKLELLHVRWAVCQCPAAAEEKLHQIYEKKHGQLPKYVRRT